MKEPSTHLIESLGKSAFTELTIEQQKQVLKETDLNQYNEWQSVHQLLQSHVIKHPLNPKQKQELLNRFDTEHTIPIWQQPITFWKAASIILLLALGWLFHWQQLKTQPLASPQKVDTVYLEKHIPVKVYDTVYIQKSSYKQVPQAYKKIPDLCGNTLISRAKNNCSAVVDALYVFVPQKQFV
jgi:hypothetical protein